MSMVRIRDASLQLKLWEEKNVANQGTSKSSGQPSAFELKQTPLQEIVSKKAAQKSLNDDQDEVLSVDETEIEQQDF